MKTLIYSLPSGVQSIPSSFTSRRQPHAIVVQRLALPFFLFSVALLVEPCAATPGQWNDTGRLITARALHTATLLPNGKVLVAGGASNPGFLSSAELYDPATGTWTATAASAAHASSMKRRCCPVARYW